MRRINVVFTDRTVKCLELLMEGGDSQTDIVNQSVQKNAYLEWRVRQGSRILVAHPDGTQQEVVFSYRIPEEA
jgi:hypothetical protein